MAREVAGENSFTNIGPVPSSWRRTSALPNTAFPISAEPVAGLEASVLPIVGASRRLDCTGNWVMNRDAHDTQMITQYTNNTGPSSLGSTEVDYGGYPVIADGTPCTDTDHDGMPDVWELARGLNINNAADRNGIGAGGFTNLEIYLAGTDTPVTGGPPTVSVTAPINGSTVAGSAVTVSATASDDIGVLGVQFKLDGANLGSEDTTAPYSVTWNTTTASEGSHLITAVARDAVPSSTTSTAVNVTVDNIPAPAGPPRSHWKFDETSGTTAFDFITANSNHLTLNSGASFVAGGQVGRAISLNGSDGEAADAATSGLNLDGAITIAAWLKPTSLPAGFATVVVKGNNSPGRGYGFNIFNGKMTFVKVGVVGVTSTVSVPVGTFHHFAISWSGTSNLARFYIDGVLSQTINDAGNITPPIDTDGVFIGKFPGGTSPYNGLIDDVRIYGCISHFA